MTFNKSINSPCLPGYWTAQGFNVKQAVINSVWVQDGTVLKTLVNLAWVFPYRCTKRAYHLLQFLGHHWFLPSVALHKCRGHEWQRPPIIKPACVPMKTCNPVRAWKLVQDTCIKTPLSMKLKQKRRFIVVNYKWSNPGIARFECYRNLSSMIENFECSSSRE